MIKIVKAFLDTLFHSLIPHVVYYSKIIRSSFSFSIRYFLMMLFLLNLIFISSLFFRYHPSKTTDILKGLSQSLSQYPKDLVISIYEGKLITNYGRPYFLWLDYRNKKNLLLVIDETAKPEKINSYKSLFLATSTDLVFKNKKTQSPSVISLNYFTDQKLTKEKINQIVAMINTIKSWLPVIYLVSFPLLLLVFFTASLIITFIYLFVASLLVFVVYKFIAKKHFKFKKILQISFHASTFPLILDYSVITLQPSIKLNINLFMFLKQIPFPLIFLIIITIFVLVGVYEAHGDGTHSPKHKKHQ